MLLDFSSVLAEGSGKDLKMMSDLGWMTIVKRCFGAACCVGMVVLMDLKVSSPGLEDDVQDFFLIIIRPDESTLNVFDCEI